MTNSDRIADSMRNVGFTISDTHLVWKALEKQMPKKPIKIDYKTYENVVENAEFLRGMYLCPNCKQAISGGTYCIYCGQRLDWKE